VTLPFLLGAAALLAALAPVLGRVLGREAGWPLAAGLAGLGVWLLVAVPPDGRSVQVEWLPSLGVSFALRLDGLGRLFAILVLVIGGAVLAYSCRYFDRGPHADFYGLMTLFSVGMLGLVLADDVVVMLVMWEVTTICSFFLISRSGPKGQESAARTLLITVGGGLALLAAVVVMISATGTSQLSAILASPLWASDPVFATTVGLLIAVAAFTKSAQFPFHGWLPDSMVAATPISAYLHAAAMVKAGIYLLMRFSPALGETLAWNVTLVVIGLVTAVMGALFALQRSDLKELLAYSTVSQLGLLVATIGLGTREALSAAVVHTVAHALFKGALFMLIGVVDHQAGTREVDQLSGLRRSMPFTFAGVVLACLSMAGIPPLLGFISKEKIFAAMWDAPGPGWIGPTAALVAVAASVLTLAYTGRILLGAFFGPTLDPSVREASPAFLAPVLVLAAAGLVLGPAADLIEPTVTAAADAAAALPIGETALYLWPGLVPELYLSIVSIVLGLLAIRYRHRLDAALDRPLFPGTAVGTLLALRAGVIALGGRVGDLTRSDTVRRQLAPPVLAVVAVGGLALVLAPAPDLAAATAASRPSDVALVVLVGVGVLGVVTARSRLAAVAVLGVVGFGMSLWFLALGAVDAALTQLLVEVLTVAVAVLVLRRLPRRFHPQRRARTVAAAAAALGAGAAAFVGVLALTGRPDVSAVGRYYLERAEPETGGTNVVNTILVDFRALDTFGELVVLGTAGLAVLVVLEVRRLAAPRRPRLAVPALSPSRFAWDNAVYARVVARVLVPLMLVLSLFFLVRGHDQPGGGFNAALTGTAAFVLRALAASSDREGRSRLPAVGMIAGGLLVCVLSGLAGFADGAFLRPLSSGISVLGVSLTSALLFDVGVYLVVMGAVVAALDRLGPLGTDPPDADEDEPGAGSRSAERVAADAGGERR
jgi:multicomponent Na+:H+ antiporter subunit A